MYNAKKPRTEDLPSSAQLLRSTLIALIAAIVILVTVVLPAEYGIDPTGVGRVLDLTEMGEIKTQLAEEAEQDRLMDAAAEEGASLFDSVFDALIGTAYAGAHATTDTADQTEAETEVSTDAAAWTDEFSFTLAPGEGIEWKLVMEEGAVAEFDWAAEGGRVNFDLHGDGSGQKISYEKGRGSEGATGEIVAAFAGNHGWFWRNRDTGDVTVTVELRGASRDLTQTY